MKKKILIIAAAVLALVLVAAADVMRNDPNLVMKEFASDLIQDETEEVEFDHVGPYKIGRHRIPVYTFTPEEDAEYSFTVSDIKTDDDVFITMSVCDRDLNDFIIADNFNDHADSISGSEFLSEDSECFVIINAIADNDDRGCSGSFRLTVTKLTEDTAPIELTEAEPVTVSMNDDEMSSVLFRPKESGFYRFSTSVFSKKEEAGFSFVSMVRDDEDEEVRNTEGISYLEEDNSYYVWVSASELTQKQTDVKVSCSRIAYIKADSPGSYSINGPSIIGFKSKDTVNYAVYSLSDSNIKGSVYDSKGFPLNKDNNSGGTLSENSNDFALILQAEKDKKYLIFADGEFSKCVINIAVYKGDGTALGPEDIELPASESEGEEAKQEGSAESEEKSKQ
ncbi:MAG: hypothetical protein IKE74_03520 [Mogibacterium sp.]|nr:hypothetical protein [Mogibacterium sp.]